MGLKERWEKFEDEDYKLKRETPTERPDLKAFILLNKLVPGTSDMVSAAEHDQIFLDVDVDKLEKVVTDEEIRTLVACGVHYDEHYDSLYMFV